MFISEYIGNLASLLWEIGAWFTRTAEDIEEIWAVGEALALPFHIASIYFFYAQLQVLILQSHWNNLYYYLDQWVNNAQDLIEIVSNKWDILDWVYNGFANVKVIIDFFFPDLQLFFDDPAGYVMEGLGGIFDEINYRLSLIPVMVENAINYIIPDSWTFTNSPFYWIINRLSEVEPEAGDFLQNPAGWFANRIESLFPEIRDFFRDPAGYILPRLITMIKNKLNQYSKPIIDLATEILSRLY